VLQRPKPQPNNPLTPPPLPHYICAAFAVSRGAVVGGLDGAAAVAGVVGGAATPAAVWLIYPSLDLTAADGELTPTSSYHVYGEGHYLRTASVRHYVKVYLGTSPPLPQDPSPSTPRLAFPGVPDVLPADHVLVSPLLAPAAWLARMPPVWSFTAECDPIRDDGDRLQAALTALSKAGARSDSADHHHRHAGFIHAWMHLVTDSAAVPHALEAMGKQVAALMGSC